MKEPSTTMEETIWNFEQEATAEGLDETSLALRAYLDRMPDEKLQQFRAEWTDEQLIEWDDNFRSDGYLMLLCCMRDVNVTEYRRVVGECIDYRRRVRSPAVPPSEPAESI